MNDDYWEIGSACFLIGTREFDEHLCGWRRPLDLLAQPTERRGYKPFTREPVVFWSRLPQEPAAAAPDALRRLDLSRLAWTGLAGLQPWDMGELGKLLLRWSVDEARDQWSRFVQGPEDANDILFVFPVELREKLRTLTREELRSAAEAWAAVLEGESDGSDEPSMTAESALEVLTSLRSLFQSDAALNREAFYWTSR